jgi:hypothetical protein
MHEIRQSRRRDRYWLECCLRMITLRPRNPHLARSVRTS